MKPGTKRNNHYQPKAPVEYTLPTNLYVSAFYAARHTYNCLLNNESNSSLLLIQNQAFGKKDNLSDLRYMTVYMLRYVIEEMEQDRTDAAIKYKDPADKKDTTAMLAVNHASKEIMKKACDDAFDATGLQASEIVKMKEHICGKKYTDFSIYEEYLFRKAWSVCVFNAANNFGYIYAGPEGKYYLSSEPFIKACEDAAEALPEDAMQLVRTFIMTCQVDNQTGQLYFPDDEEAEEAVYLSKLSSFTKIYLWHVAKQLGFF